MWNLFFLLQGRWSEGSAAICICTGKGTEELCRKGRWWLCTELTLSACLWCWYRHDGDCTELTLSACLWCWHWQTWWWLHWTDSECLSVMLTLTDMMVTALNWMSACLWCWHRHDGDCTELTLSACLWCWYRHDGDCTELTLSACLWCWHWQTWWWLHWTDWVPVCDADTDMMVTALNWLWVPICDGDTDKHDGDCALNWLWVPIVMLTGMNRNIDGFYSRVQYLQSEASEWYLCHFDVHVICRPGT